MICVKGDSMNLFLHKSPMTTLHTLNDGSKVRLIQAKELIQIPIWNGNRIKSGEHVEKIKKGVSDIKTLDFGFRLVSRTIEDADGKRLRETVVVDGQHRHQVLSDHFKENLCSPDFPIVIVEKEVYDESDIISYFNTINTQNPISWTDPTLVVNKYIEALLNEFKTKDRLIRDGATKRPYLSVEKLRVELCKRVGGARGTVKDFILRVTQYNTEAVKNAELSGLYAKKGDVEILEKAKNLKFMLAVDVKLSWVSECV